MDKALELAGVSRSFRELEVLRGIYLCVRPGEIFGLVGPNGAGKTTAVRVILGTLCPNSGSVRIMGMDSFVDRRRALSNVGFMLEKASVNVGLTLDENLGIYSRIYGIDGSRRRIDEVIEIVGMVPWRSTTLSRYSKGMLQKAALCRALLHDPSLLILDEPSSGMDPILQEEFRMILTRLRDRGKAIFLCSHDLLEVERMCTHVGVLKDGRIVTTGNIAELRDSCRFTRYRLTWQTNGQAADARRILASCAIVRNDFLEEKSVTVLIPESTTIEDFLAAMDSRVAMPEQCQVNEMSLSDIFFCEITEHHEQGSAV